MNASTQLLFADFAFLSRVRTTRTMTLALPRIPSLLKLCFLTIISRIADRDALRTGSIIRLHIWVG